MTKHPEHICRFNDLPQSCDCYDEGYDDGLKAHREAMEKVLRLSELLEAECGLDGDKGTKQWLAFKGFRNNIREIFNIDTPCPNCDIHSFCSVHNTDI